MAVTKELHIEAIGPIHTSTVAVKAFLDLLGVFDELETNIHRERQLEGIVKAKSQNNWVQSKN